MVSASSRDEKVVWRKSVYTEAPDALGQSPPTDTEIDIWISWMELGGSQRDSSGLLGVPGTRVVAYASHTDDVRVQDAILRGGEVYEVLGVTELTGRQGYRLELELNAAVQA